MSNVTPSTPQELRDALTENARTKAAIQLSGGSSKRRMAGPAQPASITISTTGLNRMLQYEPCDLTVSVEAGMRWSELTRILAENRQMLPLDPPFFESATVGGVLATNGSGPRRRLYGTARDFVIGMQFATLAGKLVQSGGMVVKNVAGLDMAKLMIGSFGTLAAIVSANFKVVPIPAASRTFLYSFDTLEEAIARRDNVLGSVLQPAAIDLFNLQAAGDLGREGCLLAIQAGGSPAVLERYARELKGAVHLDAFGEQSFWQRVREYTPAYLAQTPSGVVVRVSSTLADVRHVAATVRGAVVSRAGSGVTYAHFVNPDATADWLDHARSRGWKTAIEFAPEGDKQRLDSQGTDDGDFEMMQRIKQMFDPDHLLNRGRLYGRI